MITFLGRRLRSLVFGWTTLLTVVLVHGIVMPDKWAALHTELPVVTWTGTGITILLSVGAAMRYWQSYLYSTPAPLPKSITYASLWIAGAQWIITTGELWRLSWWLYHFLLLGAVLALLVGVFEQFVRGESLNTALKGLLLSDPVDRLDVGLSPGVPRWSSRLKLVTPILRATATGWRSPRSVWARS